MMYKLICILFILSVVENVNTFECEKSVTTTDSSNEKRLRDDLMCNYNKYYLPLKNRSEEMDIKFDMFVDKYWISSHSLETLHIQSIISVFWYDINLKWTPEDYGSIKEMIIDSNDIWKPEIMPQEIDLFTLKNSLLKSSKCNVKWDGYVSCVARSSHHGFCESELYYWPYEIHQCVIQYMLWTYDGEIINTDVHENKTIKINDQNKDWKIVDSKVDNFSVMPEQNIFISEMYFYFDVQQDMNNSIQLFHITFFTLLSLTILSFWTYFDETSRLVLVLINILCHFYELQNFQWHLTTAGPTIPYILSLYRDSLVLTFVQLIETIALKKMFESDSPVPYLITLFSNLFNLPIIKQILFIQINDLENGIEDENNIEYVKKMERNKKREILVSVDRVFFVIVVIGYLVLIIILTSL